MTWSIFCFLDWKFHEVRDSVLFAAGRKEGGWEKEPVEVLGYTLKVSDFNVESTVI